MLGVILCGGQSVRMGQDKGLLQRNGKTWAQIARDKITFLSLHSVISINASQVTAYSSVFDINELVVDHSEIDIGGPLLGLFSVHQLFPGEDLLLLACDLVEMKPDVLDVLLSTRNQKKDAEAIVFKSNDRLEPLCGIYSAAGLDQLLKAHQNKDLKRHSMHYALEQLTTHYIPLREDWVACFQNFNSAIDLQ